MATRRSILCWSVALLLLTVSRSAAQPLLFYLGPTVGVTTPGLRSHAEQSDAGAAKFFREERTPVVSPLLGLSSGFHLFNRIGIDAGLHYSHTGYRYVYRFADDQVESRYDEELVLHKLSVPVTVGYRMGLGRARLRLGAGIAYVWYFAGTFKSAEQQHQGTGTSFATDRLDVFTDVEDRNSVYPRRIHPRASLQFAPVKRLIIGLAATLGYDVTLPREGSPAQLNRSDFAAHALDATLTWSLR